jgi:hypothetical protein
MFRGPSWETLYRVPLCSPVERDADEVLLRRRRRLLVVAEGRRGHGAHRRVEQHHVGRAGRGRAGVTVAGVARVHEVQRLQAVGAGLDVRAGAAVVVRRHRRQIDAQKSWLCASVHQNSPQFASVQYHKLVVLPEQEFEEFLEELDP